VGAIPWQARAEAELRATGETARKRDPSTHLRKMFGKLGIASRTELVRRGPPAQP
jgi:hypothetical protein